MRRWIAALCVAAGLALLVGLRPTEVLAHTEFESSDPADGAAVAEPVTDVIVTFTGPATPVGEGFEVLDPQGTVREPDDVVAGQVEGTDDATFTLRFEPPLAGGSVGVRWSVEAADGHSISGSFSFEVIAPVVTPTTAPVPVTSAPAPAAPARTAPPSASPTTLGAPSTTIGSAGAGHDRSQMTPDDHAAMSSEEHAAMDEFLEGGDGASSGKTLGRIGRVLGIGGTVLAIGGLAVLAFVLRAEPGEIARLVTRVRLSGVAVLAGALVEMVGHVNDGSAIGDVLWSSTGTALILRAAGGVALVVGIAGHVATGEPSPAGSLSAALAPETPASTTRSETGATWRLDRASLVGLVGAGALAVSFCFDGHTATEGVRSLHIVMSIVHVVAGSVWAGGVITLALMLRRARSGRDLDAARLIARFSAIAAPAAGLVALAGVVMATQVLDRAGDLVDTSWGKALVIKVSAVAVAACLGAYNHFSLGPSLEAGHDDPGVARRGRRVLAAEAVVMMLVVVVTAWLVALAA